MRATKSSPPSRHSRGSIAITEQVEVLSLVGDIALENATPRVHAHVVIGKRDGTAHGGHLIEGHVRPTTAFRRPSTARWHRIFPERAMGWCFDRPMRSASWCADCRGASEQRRQYRTPAQVRAARVPAEVVQLVVGASADRIGGVSA